MGLNAFIQNSSMQNFYFASRRDNGKRIYQANIYLFQGNNRNTRESCEIFLKLTMKAPEQRQWHFFLLFLLFTFNN